MTEHPLLRAVRPLVDAVGGRIVPPDEAAPGDVPLVWEGRRVAAVRLADLHGALGRMIAQVEEELGAPLADLDREGKQAAVRILDERGAFLLRKAIETVAEALGVSRITVYNYLNAIREGTGRSQPL